MKLLYVSLFTCISITYAQSISVNNCILPTSFDKAMISNPDDEENYAEFVSLTPDTLFLNHVKETYYAFINNISTLFHEQLLIPKIIHQIWIGPRPFPEKALKWKESWQKMHPDWEYKLWTNADVQHFDFANKKYFNQATNWGEKADILRYELVYRFGGLYVDIDFECLKPFDWLHHCCDFYAGIQAIPLLFNHKLRVANGLIAARPEHPILAHAIARIKDFRQGPKVSTRTGPRLF